MTKNIDYCKGRIKIQIEHGSVVLQYKFDFSHEIFHYGIDLEMSGEIKDESELRVLEMEIRNFIPTSYEPIFDVITQLMGEYFDDPKKFDNKAVFRLGKIEP